MEYTKCIVTDAQTGACTWDVYYADMAIVSTDGTVTPIYDRESAVSLEYYSSAGITNEVAQAERSNTTNDAIQPANSTTYYVGDQIGSERMLLAAGGWPLSLDTYYPYGVEASPSGGANHYKFTGKERDAESGLDYFGARYYSSNMGRFMSPDWSAMPEATPYADLDNPQSLNLYVYVLNNPLFKADLDGHGCPPDCSTGNPVVDFITGASNAWTSDNALGLGRNNQSSVAGQFGQLVGDAAALYTGTSEAILGSGGEIGGAALDATGIGAAVGVPANVVSAGVIAHGATTDVVAGSHIAMALNQSKTGPGSVPKEQRAKPRTATANERTEMRKEQGGNCAHCGKSLNGDEISHHYPERHADGGRDQKLVHAGCHDELHGKC